MKYLVKLTLTNGETLKTEADISLVEMQSIFTSNSTSVIANNNRYMINPSHIVYLTYKELEE